MMKTELYRYRITPGIIKTNTKTTLKISPLEPQFAFEEDAKYRIEVWGLTRRTEGDFMLVNNIFTVNGKNGELFFTYSFEVEEEYYVRVFNGSGQKQFLQLSVYAVKEDLYALRPLKGDFHVHSTRSDGKECPAVVAANYREAGFDFMAVTDHRRYFPSVEAQEAYKDVPLGMLLLNGEEVHSPDNYVHVIHFGGDSGVNEIYEKDEDKYYKDVQAIIDSQELPYFDKFTYAANMWVVQKIREANGLAVFCHPHWIPDTYDVPDSLSRAFLENGVFDAFELIGGQTSHENNMQVAFYNQLRTEGVKIPITGASDSHGTINSGLFDKMFTIVFAKDNSRDSIIEAVKDCLSVAVEVYDDSVNYSVHGCYRLVSFARFLIEHYFALTARLCREEGILMRSHLLGDEEATARLSQLKSRTDDFYKTYAGK